MLGTYHVRLLWLSVSICLFHIQSFCNAVSVETTDVVKDSIRSYDGGSAHHLAVSDMGNEHIEERRDQNSFSLDVTTRSRQLRNLTRYFVRDGLRARNQMW